MKLNILKAATDVTVYLFIQNSSSTTGAGLTGLVFNSASLVCYYVRPLGNATQLTLATQTVTGAHSDGGFVEVDATNMPGVYRLDLSDAICATGVNSVVVMLKGATNMAPLVLEIQLVSYNPNDAVRLGLTALPNAAADAAGGLPISDAGGLDLDGRLDVAVSSRLAPTVAARTLDVSAAGNAGIDWGNVENPTTANNLSATNIDPDQVVASVTGAVGSVTGSVGSVAAGGITAASIATGAIDADAIADNAIDAGAIASDAITAAKIADGAIDAATFAAGAITAAAIATDAIDADALAADAIAEINATVDAALADIHLDHLLAVEYDPQSKPGAAGALLNELVESDDASPDRARFTAGALEEAPTGGTPAAIADAVWDELIAGHLGAGSTGEALNAAGSAGDPWTTTLPGAYTGSQAGKILADVLVDTGTTLQAELDGIQADTEDIQTRLPAALTGAGNIKADAVAVSGDATAADTLELFAEALDQVTGQLDSGSLAAGTITAAAVADGAIDAGAIADAAIDAATFAAGAITAAAIATDAITSDKIAASAIGASELADGAITAAKIATDAIDADALAADAIAEINATVDTALADVGLTLTVTGRIDAAVSTRATPAQVNTEVSDVIFTDTQAEPGQGTPPATLSIGDRLRYLFKWTRNKSDNDGTQNRFYADDGTTVDQKQTTSEAAGTVTKGEIATGP